MSTPMMDEDEELMEPGNPPEASEPPAEEMQQGADPALVEKAKAIVQDKDFCVVLQWCHENAPDFVTGTVNALMTIVPGFQQAHQLDDETMLGPVLVAMVTGALEIADEGGNDEATPEQIDPIRDAVIDRMGRMDAQIAAGESESPAEDAGENEQNEQPQMRGRLASMMGG